MAYPRLASAILACAGNVLMIGDFKRKYRALETRDLSSRGLGASQEKQKTPEPIRTAVNPGVLRI